MVRTARSLAASLSTAWRSLTRRPAYFAIAVSSLAIAMGLATTVIAHLDSLVHPDLGTPYDTRLYMGVVGGRVRIKPSDAELLARFRALPDVERAAIARESMEWAAIELGTQSQAGRLWHAGPDVFEAIGARPIIGRWFRTDETGASDVALITEEAWRLRLASTPDLDSARLIVNGLRYRVVGVVPRGLPPFVDMCGGPGCRTVDVILPNAATDTVRNYVSAMVILRAKRGTDRESFASAADQITTQMRSQYGEATADPQRLVGVRIFPFGLMRVFRVEGYQKAMLVAVAMIVIIACANVSALMLARAVTKRRDQALRLALGAERRHVITDVAAEVAIVAFAGAVAALLIGDWSMRVLAAVTPADLPWLGFREPHWSPWVFAGLFAVVLLVVAMASIIPAIFVSRIAPVEQLKDNSGTTTGRPRRTFQFLVVGELALSLILLFGAVLVAKSADEVAQFDFGYEPRGLTRISAQVRLSPDTRSAVGRTSAPVMALRHVNFTAVDDIVNRLRREPGIRAVAWGAGTNSRTPVISDRSHQLLGDYRMFTGSGFAGVLGLQVLEGRDFVDTDRSGRGAVILDELAAMKLFPDGKAVGSMVKFGSARGADEWLTVVGVVRRAVHEFPDDPAVPIKPSTYIAQPMAQSRAISWPTFVIRKDAGAQDVAPRAAAIVADLLPPGTPFLTGPWLAKYDQILSTRRFTGGMFLTMSFASLALAVAGLFGVLSYVVNQRMREFAVRVALGAQRKHVVKLVLTEGFVMALAATAIGGAIAMYAAFVLWEWLWGVYPVDAQALIISEGTLLLITALGAILPCLRAARANPVDVMRAS